MEPAVHLRGAVSLLGRFPALAGVDLDVDAGEVVLLQGPNGAGQDHPPALLRRAGPGERGRGPGARATTSRRDRRSVRRRVGLLGHATGLYDDLTVADNVRFWTRAAGADQADAEAAMERLGLDGRLRDVPVGRLSAGQRRRTSLAVMVARRPELWLLDEPHAGLDQDGRDLVDGLIAEAVGRRGDRAHRLPRAGAGRGASVAPHRRAVGGAATGRGPARRPRPEASEATDVP